MKSPLGSAFGQSGVDYPIDGKMITAKYLVLYGNNDMEHVFIYPINTEKGRICSKKELFDVTPKKYPSTPSADHYFIFDLGGQINLDSFVFDMKMKY
jgi:hypothetical protein